MPSQHQTNRNITSLTPFLLTFVMRIALALYLLLITSTLVFSQEKTFGTVRVAVVNTLTFSDEKTGISKLVKAYAAAQNVGFIPENNNYRKLMAEIRRLKQKLEMSPSESLSIQNAINSKTAEAKALLDKKILSDKQMMESRLRQIVAPVQKDIGGLLVEFAKIRGIDIILDTSADSKLIYYNPSSDITAEFVAYANLKLNN